MVEYMYWISLSYATFGIFSRDNKTITDAAPIAHWLIKEKKSLRWALEYYKRKGAIIYERNTQEVWTQIAPKA